MAVRNPDEGLKQTDSYNVIVGVDSLDRGLSRINLVRHYFLGNAHVQGLHKVKVCSGCGLYIGTAGGALSYHEFMHNYDIKSCPHII